VPGSLVADAVDLENVAIADSGTLENGLAYEIYEDHAVITDCDTSAKGEMIIPDTIQGLPVTEIAKEAFRFCGFLTSVTVPDTVTQIGERAFSDCFALETISLPDMITSIENYAFYYCNSLQSITIPDQVTSIGEYAFYRCLDLTSVTLPDHITNIEESAFFECRSLESVTIPQSLAKLAPFAFGGCKALTKFHVDPENQNYMDVDGILFSKDQQTLVQYPAGRSEQSYTVPENVTVIGDGAFWKYDSLETIIIPDHVTEIGCAAFCSCTSLTAIEIPGSLTSISERTLEDCSSLTAITIPDSVTSIGDYAFMDCTSLTAITIPDRVTKIGVCAFGFCSALDAITILNPDCNIQVYEKEENNDFMDGKDHNAIWVEVENTISKTAVIYGYLESTAQAYAEKWGNLFIPLNETPIESGILQGDADENGKIEILDVVLMNRVYVGVDQISDSGKKNADTDQDGKITLSDSMNVLN
ncbi:MAG: leucine-rich repeat protein, partial [Oscillospiraceae bacterium]|nr:leucine-rich repeat protein [Oscillospiraceae bacterium]